MAETTQLKSNHPIQRILDLSTVDHDLEEIEAIAKALGSVTRLEILRFLGDHTCSLLEIADALGLPQSTSTMHINILEKAGLIKTDLQPAKRGVQKVCARLYDRISIQLPLERKETEKVVSFSMPIGAYTDASVAITCGLLSDTGIIGSLDDSSAFLEPDRFKAQLIWFHHGYLEYRFPNRPIPETTLENLEISLEICSEAPLHHPNWPSDITVWINQVELGCWTSPADFGGERGSLTPSWWDTSNTQFGLLKVWKVTPHGTFVDGVHISPVQLNDLHLSTAGPISVRIGVKEDADNVGGMNIFGGKFGNYPQDIVLRQTYKPK